MDNLRNFENLNNENVIEWGPGNNFATVTFNRQKFANRIRKLKEQYPDQVKIIADGPSNGGYCYAHIPSDWVRIGPPPKRELTEEQRQEYRDRFARNVLNKEPDSEKISE